MEQKWKFEVFAETDGILAVLPFGEIKIEIRKNPKAVSIRLNNNYIFYRFIE
jgi:hypothetical protein